MLKAITNAQAQFITNVDTRVLFEEFLSSLLSLTQSEYGFIGEIFHDSANVPYLKSHAITNIAWNEETRAFYERNAAAGLEFRNLNSLFGVVIATGKSVISNSPSTDPRRCGIPTGHPPLNAFLGLPFFSDKKMVGMVGIANRPEGYDEKIVEYLQPFLSTCSSIIVAHRIDKKRKDLESQLLHTQKMEAIGQLAGGIAHDFNNILSAIIGYTELALLEAENPQNLRRDLEEVLKGTNRARELVNQILTFSRKSQFQLQPIKTQLILAEALKLLRSSIPSTIEIKTDVDECCPAILADPTQFHQIIMNLCTNSYQAMKKRSGLLSISLKSEVLETIETDKPGLEPGRYVRLTISDTGEGMTKEVQEKIFEPYFTTKEKGEGTGLGLAVVHGIVSSLKGAVFVDSTPGEGACFKLFFPTCEESEREQEKSDLVAPLPRGNEKILLVDDDGVIVQMATITLEQLGYKVTSLDNSLAALKLFRENPESFDLVITDMTMPHLTGEELAELIHAIKPEIPIVISSGYSEAMSPETAHEKGITSFLQKPVKIKDLAVTVRKALERR